jgi:hypothetical protein
MSLSGGFSEATLSNEDVYLFNILAFILFKYKAVPVPLTRSMSIHLAIKRLIAVHLPIQAMIILRAVVG